PQGRDEPPAGGRGPGFTGCDALDQDGLNRITGLAELVPSLTADPAPTGVVSAASGAPASATGRRPPPRRRSPPRAWPRPPRPAPARSPATSGATATSCSAAVVATPSRAAA